MLLVRRSGTLVTDQRERKGGPYSFEEMKEFWTVEMLHPKSVAGHKAWKVGSHWIRLLN